MSTGQSVRRRLSTCNDLLRGSSALERKIEGESNFFPFHSRPASVFCVETLRKDGSKKEGREENAEGGGRRHSKKTPKLQGILFH